MASSGRLAFPPSLQCGFCFELTNPPVAFNSCWHLQGKSAANGLCLSPDADLPTSAGYDILAVPGRGGMGFVYKARHLKLKRLVALKMIIAGAHAGPDQAARLLVEAEAVARLQHPNIVQIYESTSKTPCRSSLWSTWVGTVNPHFQF